MGIVNRPKRSLSATEIRTSSLHRGARRAWAQVLERGYEGHIAKDEASPYVGGGAGSWLTVKVPGCYQHEDRQGAGPHDPAFATGESGSGDRITGAQRPLRTVRSPLSEGWPAVPCEG
jgi:hypothetical protein